MPALQQCSRIFRQSGVAIVCCLLVLASGGRFGDAGETLYNGIELPAEWPPKPQSFAREEPVTPPYLVAPPPVIPIDVGRQLFVDDFLIAESTLTRTYHLPEWYESNPVLRAKTPWETRREMPFAAPFSDGVWWDPQDRTFKMWYMAATGVFFGYAISSDGIHWERPKLNVARFGDNALSIEPVQRDSSTVWLDLEEKDPSRRFKMMYYRAGLQMRVSADGIGWSESLGAPGGSSDRSTFFYNPFRNVWVYSIRGSEGNVGRCRFYGESAKFGVPLWGSFRELPRWMCADSLDRVKPFDFADRLPDLYNLDAAPYESLLLGQFSIHAKVAEGDRPKINYVTLGYSRDGFHWHRPDRRPFLDVADDNQAWNYGNVQSAGGGCLVMGDKLYFYCSGRNSHRNPDDGTGGATGLAMLRRDGFASMDTVDRSGLLTTRPVRFSGKHLFVNVVAATGSLRVAVLDAGGKPIDGFSFADCQPVPGDSPLAKITWKGKTDLSPVTGKPVRFRFSLQNGRLYSFWVSPDESGASHGYVAAGGSGFTSHRDSVGKKAYTAVPQK